MRKLPLKYKKLFTKIFKNNMFGINDINKNTKHKELNKIYNKINEMFIEQGCDPYEINSIINSDKIDDEYTKKLRNFVYLKNKNILKEAANTEMWERNIYNIMSYCKNTYNINSDFDKMESAFLQLEKKFVMNWLGYWSTIEMNKNGKIKDINIFDMSDYETIVNSFI